MRARVQIPKPMQMSGRRGHMTVIPALRDIGDIMSKLAS